MINEFSAVLGNNMVFSRIFTAGAFTLFAILNLNDPDWFIWVPVYGIIAALILVTNSNARKLKLMAGCFFIVLGLFVFAEVLNDIMFIQPDDRMIGLWEYQREGLGLILAGISIVFFWHKEGGN